MGKKGKRKEQQKSAMANSSGDGVNKAAEKEILGLCQKIFEGTHMCMCILDAFFVYYIYVNIMF